VRSFYILHPWCKVPINSKQRKTRVSHLVSFRLIHVCFFSPKRPKFNRPYKFDKQQSYETSRYLILSVFLYFLLLCSKYFLDDRVLCSDKLCSFLTLETKLYKHIKRAFHHSNRCNSKSTVSNTFRPQNGVDVRGCRQNCLQIPLTPSV
jgi:hypothetical protein